MKTSVVLSTYNGSKYIVSQMDSILNQSMKVDEVIICDDGSSDNTVPIVRDYIVEHQLTTWHLYENEKNKGFILNFLDGAEMTTGDVLFYSDQDDVWHLEKVDHMIRAMQETNALAIYCLTNTIDSLGNKKSNHIDLLNRVAIKTKIQPLTLSEKLKYARSPGLCLCFRRELLPEVREMALGYGLPHDIPVGTIAAIKKGYYVINESLVDHRIHFNNVSTPDTSISSSFQSINKQKASRQMKLKEFQAIKGMYWEYLSENEKKQLEDAILSTEAILRDLDMKKAGRMIKIIFSTNPMMNRLLTIRNLFAVLSQKKRGRGKSK